MTNSQRRLQGLVIFILSLLLILGSLLTALAEERFSGTIPNPTSPALHTATPPPNTNSSSKIGAVSSRVHPPSPTSRPVTHPSYEISFK